MNRYTPLGLVAILLWSTTIAVARSLSEQLGAITAGACVYLTGGLLFALGSLLRPALRRQVRGLTRLYLFGCGALFVIYSAALFLALGLAADRQQVVEVGLVNYLWPILTILLSLPILRKRASLWLIPGTLLALLGIFLVLTHRGAVSWYSFSTNIMSHPAVYALGLLAAVSWALYSTLARRWSGPDGGGAVPLFIVVTGFALLLLRQLYPETGSWHLSTAMETLFMGLATALAYVCWDVAMRKGDVVLVAACSYLTPFLSTVVSCIYLGVTPGKNLWVGCVLLIAGSLLSWRSIAGNKVVDTV
jgi:drug/metabolite transporter (DMT)-like permease